MASAERVAAREPRPLPIQDDAPEPRAVEIAPAAVGGAILGGGVGGAIGGPMGALTGTMIGGVVGHLLNRLSAPRTPAEE